VAPLDDPGQLSPYRGHLAQSALPRCGRNRRDAAEAPPGDGHPARRADTAELPEPPLTVELHGAVLDPRTKRAEAQDKLVAASDEGAPYAAVQAPAKAPADEIAAPDARIAELDARRRAQRIPRSRRRCGLRRVGDPAR
jgi:hypothetical protein